MGSHLEGRRVAILAADGVEEVELIEPRRAVEEAGGQVTFLSLEAGTVQGMNGDTDKLRAGPQVVEEFAEGVHEEAAA